MQPNRISALAAASMFLVGSACQATEPPPEPVVQAETSEPPAPALERADGFVPLLFDRDAGRVHLELPAPGRDGLMLELLHVVGITTGVGSNDLGLDRGSVSGARLLRIRRVGTRLFFERPNLGYRAVSSDPDERRAGRESYATSVLWATEEFEVDEATGRVRVDVTDWLVDDHYGVGRRIAGSGEGRFDVDLDRSAVLLDSALVFPDNVELDVLVTLAGSEPGRLVREHVPDPRSLSVVQHHSFVRLPDDDYVPREFDPRTGTFRVEFVDHATALDAPLVRRFALRHRLDLEDPLNPSSPVVEPIVFYVDRGAPEPVRSALIEGASWWADAFAAAGFDGAYRVELMPEGAHPLDVRYNVIQWVHRSTRGWSYGNAVHDPRTGEIIKGHVTLGSQRVRQDRMIFEGLVGEARTGSNSSDDPLQLSLARLRQLAAHEVGHALGFAHNFSASSAGRASVMDYPAPRVRAREDGGLDLGDAYAAGIGAWDRYAVSMLYGRRPEGQRGRDVLDALVRNARERGLRYHSDADARALGTALPSASLWDDGPDAVASLRVALDVRRIALDGFGSTRLGPDQPLGELARVLVPIYFFHRYQLEAAAKTIGGIDFDHALAGDPGAVVRSIPGDRQRRALAVLVEAVAPATLDLPEELLERLAPLPPGIGATREDFDGRSGAAFDSLAAAGAAARHAFAAVLEPSRLRRVIDQHRRDSELPGFDEVVRAFAAAAFLKAPAGEAPRLTAIRDVVRRAFVEELIRTALDRRSAGVVRDSVEGLLASLVQVLEREVSGVALANDIRRYLDRGLPLEAPDAAAGDLPPGPPIGALFGFGTSAAPWGDCGCGGWDFR